MGRSITVNGGARRSECPIRGLGSFLEGLAAWVDVAAGWYQNVGQDLPVNGDWAFFARALSAATVYE